MQKQEFIQLCGQYNPGAFENITDRDYRKYESLYDELSNLDKQRFCELLMTNTKQLLAEAAREISYWRGRAEEMEADKKVLAAALASLGEYDTLAKVYDTKTIIGWKLDEGLCLTSEERDYIKRNLK